MIKSWKLFLESYTDEVSDICNKYLIENWSINPDGLIDVKGDVNLRNMGLTKIPLKFGFVKAHFRCHDNYITSLEGCPRIVGGNFNCSNQANNPQSNNSLISLEGCPHIVSGDFYCQNNNLISLEGLVTAKYFFALNNPVSNLTEIGQTMITKKISFLEAVMIHLKDIPDNELILIMNIIDSQKILDLNDFKIFNLLRTNSPEKYVEVMKLRDVDLSADLGELGF